MGNFTPFGFAQRARVEAWMRFKYVHDESSRALLEQHMADGRLDAIIGQIVADMGHSSLLVRMLEGSDPLLIEQYVDAKVKGLL